MLNLYGSFFTLIFAVLLVGANFYMRPEYLTVAISLYCIVIVFERNKWIWRWRYRVKLPTSDSTEITAGGIKVRPEGPVPLDAP